MSATATQVQGWIERYCNRIFDEDTYTDEKYDGDNSNILMLKQYPIISIESIKINGTEIDKTCYDDPANYKSGIYAESGIVKRIDGGIWTAGRQNIWVTYDAGYETLPPELQLVIDQMLTEIFDEAGKIQSERIGQYSISYANFITGNLPEKYRLILDKFKKII